MRVANLYVITGGQMVLVGGIFTKDSGNGSYIQIYDSKHPLVFQNRMAIVPVQGADVYLKNPDDCKTNEKYIYNDDEELPF